MVIFAIAVDGNRDYDGLMLGKLHIADRNKNHTGWWIFCEIEQGYQLRRMKLTARSRCRVYENMCVLRAKSRKEAYRKAMKLGNSGHPSLLPIYEPIEAGSEILWHDRGNMSVAKIRALTKTKSELPVFDDAHA